MGKQVAAGSNGGLAQLGEHLPCKQGIESSNLLVSTKAMRSGLHGRGGECACTDEPIRDRKRRANARDEISFAYESHIEMLLQLQSCLYLENRIPNQTSNHAECFERDISWR